MQSGRLLLMQKLAKTCVLYWVFSKLETLSTATMERHSLEEELKHLHVVFCLSSSLSPECKNSRNKEDYRLFVYHQLLRQWGMFPKPNICSIFSSNMWCRVWIMRIRSLLFTCKRFLKFRMIFLILSVNKDLEHRRCLEINALRIILSFEDGSITSIKYSRHKHPCPCHRHSRRSGVRPSKDRTPS